ncbi:MAG TPA: hypothetical protein VM733_11480 [Thermoanaerobaculia bacterium]|nr:hypothetical protein [Thermoanaerobaculia bacterium]
MPLFLYTAWFRDLTAMPDDEDAEWPACFVIDAPRSIAALEWGDQLARDFSARRGTEVFQWSTVEAEADPSLPVVKYGQAASDEEIGW